MAAIAGLVVALGVGAYQVIKGENAKKKARRDAAKNVRPDYSIPGYEFDNLNLLESRAGQGLSDASKRLATQNNERGLTAALNALFKGGGDMNNVSPLLQRYADSNNRLAVMDDEAKLRNINNLIAQRQRMSALTDKRWQVNQYAPWADEQQRISQQLALGEQQVNAGINAAGAGVAGYLGSTQGQSAINGLFRSSNNNNGTSPGGTFLDSRSVGVLAPTGAANNGNIFPSQSGTPAFNNAIIGNGMNNNAGWGSSYNIPWDTYSQLSPSDRQNLLNLINANNNNAG